jgi:DNA-binding HxlR family transcriptional regulator
MLLDEIKKDVDQQNKRAEMAVVVFPDSADDVPQAKPRYQLLSAFDALQPQLPIEWIVDGLISAGSVNIFYGEAGSKKTWSLLDMAVCVARGDNWLNFKTKVSNVLIVDEESGRRRMMSRMGDVLRGHNADSSTPIHSVSYARFDLGKPNDVGELTYLITSQKMQLVIIDALADVMLGKDENSVKDVQPIFTELRRIADDTQAAIIVIHHSNKNGGYRGSTAIKGALDVMVSVESKSGSDEITFKAEKNRDYKESDFTASISFMADMVWLSPSTASATQKALGKGQRYVLRYLLENGASDLDAIKDNADSCSPGSAKNSVYNLVDFGFIQRVDGGGTGVKAVWDLTDKGKEAAENG